VLSQKEQTCIRGDRPITHTQIHTHTHTMRTTRQEQSKEKRLEKLLRNCRAVRDVFRSVCESAMCSTGHLRQFVPCTLTGPHLSAALPTASINPWRSSCPIAVYPCKHFKHRHTHTLRRQTEHREDWSGCTRSRQVQSRTKTVECPACTRRLSV
jgi:hypothetical protein